MWEAFVYLFLHGLCLLINNNNRNKFSLSIYLVSGSILVTQFSQHPMKVIVLVCLGSGIKHHRLGQVGRGGLNKISLFLTVLEVEVPRSRCEQGWFFLKSLFLAWGWLPPHCVLKWPFLCSFTLGISSCSYGTSFLLDQGPTFMTSFNINYFFKGLSANMVALGD